MLARMLVCAAGAGLAAYVWHVCRRRRQAARQQADAAQIRAWDGEGGALRPGAPGAH